MTKSVQGPERLADVIQAARYLFDNRLGWSDGRAPYAPREFWADLGAALYGEGDSRVQELRQDD